MKINSILFSFFHPEMGFGFEPSHVKANVLDKLESDVATSDIMDRVYKVLRSKYTLRNFHCILRIYGSTDLRLELYSCAISSLGWRISLPDDDDDDVSKL